MTKHQALQAAQTALDNLGKRRGIAYPTLRRNLYRMSTDALIDFANLLRAITGLDAGPRWTGAKWT